MNKKFLIDTISHLPDDAEIYVSYTVNDPYHDENFKEVSPCDSISVSCSKGKGSITFIAVSN